MAASRAPKTDTETDGFSAEERAAMKERAREVRAGKRNKAADLEAEVVASIAALEGSDKRIAERLHAIVKEYAPDLAAKTWYGMPAYARDGKVVCFFKPASKFSDRYATLGFESAAELDDGQLWPTSFAVLDLTPDVEQQLIDLVRRAAG